MYRNSRRLRLISAGLTAVGLGISAATTASAGTPPDGVQEIVSTFQLGPNNSRECLDVVDASTSPGAVLQIFHCKGTGPRGSAQLFTLIPTRFGTYEILNKASNLCLTGFGDFTNIRQEDCGPPGSGQQWTLLGGPPGAFELADSESGNTLCASLEESDFGEHTPVILEPCSPTDMAESWHF